MRRSCRGEKEGEGVRKRLLGILERKNIVGKKGLGVKRNDRKEREKMEDKGKEIEVDGNQGKEEGTEIW